MIAKVTPIFINQTTKVATKGQAYKGEVIFQNASFMTIAKVDSAGKFVRNETVNKFDIYPCNSNWQNDCLVEVELHD